MAINNQQEQLELVKKALSRLSRRWGERYISAGMIYRYSKKRIWERGDDSPGTHYDLEQRLDELVKGGIAERVIACLGESTSNLKLYRMRRH